METPRSPWHQQPHRLLHPTGTFGAARGPGGIQMPLMMADVGDWYRQHPTGKRLLLLPHGDLQPQKVMVAYPDSWPLPKLIDFGLSRLMAADSSVAGGSPGWMAPEQVSQSPCQLMRDIDCDSIHTQNRVR